MQTIWERAETTRREKLSRLLEHIEKCPTCALSTWKSVLRRQPEVEYPKCDEGERLVLLALHAPKYPSGVDVILAGECPLRNENPMGCLECRFGHASECHHPMECDVAGCALSFGRTS